MPVPTAAQLLPDLIRFDTTNPPGAEAACVEHVRALLAGHGIESTLAGADPDRPSLVARVPGRGQAPALLLQGHVDVVTTVNQSWTQPPFSGAEIEGEIWGRGAVDMKGGVAMMISAALRAHEAGGAAGDLVIAVLADEEAGGVQGAAWLAENRPELFSGIRHAIGEGGGFAFYMGGRRFYPIMVAEKRGAATRVILRGPGGHASRVMRGGAMAKLGRVLNRLDGSRLPVHISTATRMMLEGLRDALDGPLAERIGSMLDPAHTDAVLDELGAEGRSLDPLLHNTANATMVEGGLKINVIPSEVTLDLDCRLLPGQTPSDLHAELRDLLGEDLELVPLRESPKMPEPELGPFYDTLVAILREADGEGAPIPYLVSGGTDARHFARLGIRTYGFLPHNWPQEPAYERHLHDADERVPVSALEFGTEAIHQALLRYRG